MSGSTRLSIATAGRKYLRASGILLTALLQGKLGWVVAGGWIAATVSRSLAQGAHQHGMRGVGKQSHIGLQHFVMEARCEQLAVLVPRGPLEEQQAFPWGKDGRGRDGHSTTSLPHPTPKPSPVLPAQPHIPMSSALQPPSLTASGATSLGSTTLPFLKPLPCQAT